MFHIAALVSSFLAAQSTAPLSRKMTETSYGSDAKIRGTNFTNCSRASTSDCDTCTGHCRAVEGAISSQVWPCCATSANGREVPSGGDQAPCAQRAGPVRYKEVDAREASGDAREIDQLFGSLELKKHAQMTEWRRQWTQQCNRMYALFRVRVDDPKPIVVRLANPQIAEILGIMKFELEYHTQEIPQQQVKLMRKTISKVLRCSNVHVPKISPFFIPSVDMELGEIHDKIKDTNCEIKRSVYDQETRLIAQYLSADNRYARQLFWEATEIWHGFEHPNVAKIVGESMLERQLHPLLSSERENNQRNLWRMFLQVGHGLNHIHQRGGIHGNLKCSHILVAENGTPKICHLELIKGAEVGAVDRWKGPEYNLGKGLDPSKAGDVYAFGLCIIEARTGDIPYGLDCDDSVKSKLEELECYPRPAGMRDDDEWNVVKRFVAHDPTDRPTMAQAIEMMEELVKKKAMEEKKW
ncbi:Protein kinase-like domain [Phytophthora cactorum]|nr:Protein kinase-like domain [Phytophthora cactorum]